MWVYTMKFKADEYVEKYKTILLAKGFTKREGLDCHEILSLMAKIVLV